MENVEHEDHCGPSEPAPTPQQQETKTCQGEIAGTVNLQCECCCYRLRTRTFVVQLSPQQLSGISGYLLSTVNAYENAGYLVLAHSLVAGAGAGSVIALTIGWYV